MPEAKVKEVVRFIADDLERYRDRLLKGQGPGPSPAGGATDNTGYLLFALAVAGYEPDRLTAAAVDYTLGRDKDHDHWRSAGSRPPSEASSFTPTALAVRGLKRFAPKERAEEVGKRIAAARGWLARTPAKDTEDRVFKLVGLKAADGPAEELAAAAEELLTTQRADGGWGQTDTMDSDAYATGSALYALATAGSLAADAPAYRAGLAFLLGTQRGDGSWHVRTRSRPVQRYFETGFPHEKDQFISCAATGWATAALALSLPAK